MTENTTKEDWEINIRTDLWHKLTTQQLEIQRDLIVTKTLLLSKLSNTSQSATDILLALQRAHDHLNELINNGSDKQKRTIL